MCGPSVCLAGQIKLAHPCINIKIFFAVMNLDSTLLASLVFCFAGCVVLWKCTLGDLEKYHSAPGERGSLCCIPESL